MAKGFLNLRFHFTDIGEESTRGEPRILTVPDIQSSSTFSGQDIEFDDDETAARFYLQQELGLDQRPAMRALAAPEELALVPNLDLDTVETQPLTGTRLVQFHQSQAAIPVFGSQAVVEMTDDRSLVGMDLEMAPLDGLAAVSPVPSLDVAQARTQLAAFVGADPAQLTGVEPPTLMLYYAEEDDTWHLVYFFRAVPGRPETGGDEAGGHGMQPSLRELQPEFDVLVDAHDGRVVFYYPAHAMFDVPTRCLGVDEAGVAHTFFGHLAGSSFELFDPMRNLKTCDLQFGVIDPNQPPQSAVTHAAPDWADTHRAAVSAHVNATRVYDFYKSVLQRNGIDNQGMALVSVVNCLQKPNSGTRVLRNAFWWKNHMWYGQELDSHGQLRSMASYLDIIAHELTHGVTEYSSGLIYAAQSGALNESFSDIFGVIIYNWYTAGAESDVAGWCWEIGANWHTDGRPLRDLRDPARAGQPAHMQDFVVTFGDSGGVHTNSGIHNKAAYNVLTAVDAQGNRVFTAREAAILFYLTLHRLPPQATFARVLQVLIDVAATFYAGSDAERGHKTRALRAAYAAVGIE